MLVTKQLDLEDHNGQFVAASTDGSGCVAFFVVGGFLSVSPGGLWIVAKACEVGSSPTAQLPNYNEPLMIRATIPSFYKNGSTFQFL